MIIISNLHSETKALLVVMILGVSCLIREALKMKANECMPLILRAFQLVQPGNSLPYIKRLSIAQYV